MNFEFSYKKNKIIFLFALIPIIIVIYNTSRIWDIYDASYILENAYFISLGKIPYRDFMIHVTPGSFFMQAFIIKFIGFTLYSQIIYCSIISVLTFLLTFRILFFFNSDKWLNIAIALPVSVTGGYGILSTPFYDPDTVFFSLISIFIIILCYKKSFPPLLTFFAGLCAFLPFFFKQNIGIAYMFAINVFLIAVVFYKNEGLNLRKYLLFLTGTITAIALFIFYLLATSSINDFYNCIFGYTFGHYLKSRSSSFAQNFDIKALKYTLIILLTIPALKYLHVKKIWLYFVVLLLAVTPLYLIPFYKLVIKDLDFYLEFLIILPVFVNIFIIAAVYSFIWLKELPIFIRLIPFLILTVIYADIMSHGYWGSHYGVWPLFSLLFSSLFLILSKSLFKKHISLLRGLVIVNCIIIAVSMFFYITTNKFYTIFLEFDFNKKVYHSETNNIKGLSLPGEMVPNMDNLFKFVQTEIPANDPIIIVMHEDPFYIATGRYPHFPVLINDVTLDFFPYQEMVEKINSYNIKWMIIKTELQTYFLHDTTFTGKYLFPLISHLKESFILYKNLPGYQIYKKPD